MDWGLFFLGVNELFPPSWSQDTMRALCPEIPVLCQLGVFLISDADPFIDDEERTEVYLGHYPAGTSW